jgi:antibiotic biosynthesis monooxygenase (ABM) superfamily enzyme
MLKFSPVSHGATSRAIGGAELFIHEDGNETEFVTLLRFDSMEAVKEFAGMDESKPVIYPKAEALLTRMDERSHHYRIAISR